MKFTLDKQDRHTVFTLQEENLNSLISPALKAEFIFLEQEGVRNLILDMSEVKYVDSSGLSSILTANRLFAANGALVIAGATAPSVKKLIEISRLESILTLVPTLPEAVDYIFMEDIERELNSEEE